MNGIKIMRIIAVILYLIETLIFPSVDKSDSQMLPSGKLLVRLNKSDTERQILV